LAQQRIGGPLNIERADGAVAIDDVAPGVLSGAGIVVWEIGR
jgi:hypothetical protein